MRGGRDRAKAGRRRRSSGGAAIEFALIMPVMALLAGGSVEFGRLFAVTDATNQLATQYALAWANCSESSINTNGVCSQELPNYTTAASIANVAPQLVLADLTLTMVEFTVSSTGVATPVYSGGYPGVDSVQLGDATTVAGSAFTLFAGPSAVQYVVVVEAKYTHSLLIFGTLMAPFLNQYLIPSFTAVQLKS